ncbi:MAG: DUF167 family protein [Alphaproteobacteria bacterium]
MGEFSDQVCRRSRDGIIVTVRLTPKSSCDEISGAGIYNGMGVLKAKVRAIPDKGKANTALEKLIAKWLRVPVSSVRLSSGSKSRLKSIGIHGDSSDLLSLVEARLADAKQLASSMQS